MKQKVKYTFPESELKKLGFKKEVLTDGDEQKLEQYTLPIGVRYKFGSELLDPQTSIRVRRTYRNKTLFDLKPDYHKYNKNKMGVEWQYNSEYVMIGVTNGCDSDGFSYLHSATRIKNMSGLKSLITLLDEGEL
jgi:hypothetical protein